MNVTSGYLNWHSTRKLGLYLYKVTTTHDPNKATIVIQCIKCNKDGDSLPESNTLYSLPSQRIMIAPYLRFLISSFKLSLRTHHVLSWSRQARSVSKVKSRNVKFSSEPCLLLYTVHPFYLTSDGRDKSSNIFHKPTAPVRFLSCFP